MSVALTEIRSEGEPTRLGVTRMGATRFESTNLDAAEAFYSQALGLERVFRGRSPTGLEEAIFRLPSGQLVIIEKVDRLGPRTGAKRWRGHHTALHIEPSDYPTLDARIMAHRELAASISHGEGYARAVDALYVHDPSDNRLQVSSYDEDTARAVPKKAVHGPAIREAGMAPSDWSAADSGRRQPGVS